MSSNGEHDQSDRSILGSLPRTRPQRRSPRRASKPTARATGTGKTAERATGTGKTTGRTASTRKAPPQRRREPPAPRQGYEPVEEPKRGATVHPPSSVELVESVATIVAELAGAGLKAGGRVLKEALSPLRRP